MALVTDPFGGVGGIAQYNRDVISTLTQSTQTNAILSLPRLPPVRLYALPFKLEEKYIPSSSLRYAIRGVWLAVSWKPDLILCGHINLLPAAVLVKKVLRIPLILEVYGIDAWRPKSKFQCRLVESVDLVFAISRYTRNSFMSWAHVAPHKVRVLPNAIHRECYTPAGKPEYLVERYNLAGKRVLLTVGRLVATERYKGQDRIIPLIPALRYQYPDLVYLIVGDGSDRSRLEELATSLGVQDHVVFAGEVDSEQLSDHYNVADAFAMPSTGEGFGFVFLEAAACGLPILGGDSDGSRDALAEGCLGMMVDPRNDNDLTVSLVQLLKQKKQIPAELTKFDFDRFRQHLEQLLHTVSPNSSSRTRSLASESAVRNDR
ncbi:MAG: glycosyltransferase family 4 protein, partial [Gammaproteobacteria bacterium]|nr:glycosyltransferase family 4 protein [Gammaproteobacteria bacterium]